MEFKKQEWTQFRSMDTLTQKAGVSKKDILKLVAKELTDNAAMSREVRNLGTPRNELSCA